MGAEDRRCRVCGGELVSTHRLICNQCKHSRDKIKWSESYEAYIGSRIRIAKTRAKKNGIAFEIDKEFILQLLDHQDHRCAVTGLPFTRTTEHGEYDLSIDRLNSDLGYEKDNVVLVCNRANVMKNNMSLPMFVWWCKAVANYDEDRRSRKET